MKLRNLIGGGVAMVGLIGGIALASPAVANEPDDGTQYVRVQMTGVPVTAKNALEHGFDVRTDSDGVQYAVGADTPQGDFSRAVEIVPEPEPGQVTPYDTVFGSCGYSWFFFDSKTKYSTGYEIDPAFGYTINFGWTTHFSSSIDLHTNTFGSPFATQRWDSIHLYAHGAQALAHTIMTGFASGNVLTTGGICYSEGPSDLVEW